MEIFRANSMLFLPPTYRFLGRAIHASLLGVILLTVLAAAPVFSQQAPAPRLYAVTYIDVFPDGAAKTAELLHQLAAEARKDAGSVRFEVLRDIQRTNHLTIVEVWQDRAAYDTHLKHDHTRQFREGIQPVLGSPFDTRLYNLFD